MVTLSVVTMLCATTLIQHGRRNRSGQSGHGLTSFGSSILKNSHNELKSARYLCLNLCSCNGFIITVYNAGLAKV